MIIAIVGLGCFSAGVLVMAVYGYAVAYLTLEEEAKRPHS
jgi:hypothetical protein